MALVRRPRIDQFVWRVRMALENFFMGKRYKRVGLKTESLWLDGGRCESAAGIVSWDGSMDR